MSQLVLIRHGQSVWNSQNRFTGWWDVDLTENGIAEAAKAGEELAAEGFDFDLCFTSLQTRAIRTLNEILYKMDRMWLPVVKDYRFNERHYGGLTGLNKAETAKIHGDDQVKIWRRSFDTPPPPQEAGSEFDVAKDRRYAGVTVPKSESLKNTIERVLPAYEELVVPELKAGKRVLIAAHGNSLRALVKHLSGISDEEILHFEIPTGRPIVYELDDQLNAVSRRFLGE